MALTTEDLFKLELKARMLADALRKEVEAQPASTPGLKAMDEAKLADAKSYDAIGDLLMGLQGDWQAFSERVRDGYRLESKRRGGSKKPAPMPPPDIDEAAA